MATTLSAPSTDRGLDREVRFGELGYGFHVRSGAHSWAQLTNRARPLAPDRFLIVTDAGVPEASLALVRAALEPVAGCVVLTVSAHESVKSLPTLDDLAEKALQAGATRASVVVAFGGGLVGNLAGLLATLLFRGIPLVHLPTTLLAMSDSVLSLKQAVNSRLGKNHLGAFRAPAFVWNCLDLLSSLPVRENQSALCEMIKNVVTICPDRYDEVARALRSDGHYDHPTLIDFIGLCVDAKTEVMREDPYERGPALVLEYGHTVGHAVELLSGGRVPHGFAIGMGMAVAARIAVELGHLDRADEAAQAALLARLGAPTRLPELDPDEIMGVVALDNKRGYVPERPGHHGFILLEALGRPHHDNDSLITLVDDDVVRDALRVLREVPAPTPAPTSSSAAPAPHAPAPHAPAPDATASTAPAAAGLGGGEHG